MKTLIPLCLFALALQASAQGIPSVFREVADSLIRVEPKSHTAFEKALEPYRRDTVLMKYFIRECEMAGFTVGTAFGFEQVAGAYQSIGRYARGIEYYSRALDAANQSKNREFQVVVQNRLGITYRKMESIRSALEYHQKAMNLAESIENPSNTIMVERNNAINGIGNIYRLMGQYGLAIEYFQRSLEYDGELGNLQGQASNFLNIAECLEAIGDHDGSLEYYEDALQANETMGSDRVDIIAKYGIAHVMAHEDQANEALALLESVLAKGEALGDPEILSSLYLQVGWVLTILDRYEEARSYLLRSIGISEDLNMQSNLHSAYNYLHDIERARGNYREALAYYKTAETARRRIANTQISNYVTEMISKSEAEERMDQIKFLNQENQIVKLKLRRNRTTLLVGALLLVLFTLILYILYRQYQLNSEKKMLTLEQSMLRSQMNPHFLFNSLNSIKLYIINNEQKNAVHYLNKFSKLVRKILEASSLKEIPLEEELETAVLYMNIENIRFNGEIDFAVETEPEINTSLIKIPSLILQPFLENALWHGLSSVEGPKIIRILIRKEPQGYITIVIRDNGIGREAAEKVRERRVLKRKSVGISITRERLANFSKDYQNRYSIDIRDLHDEEGNPTGTEVVLKVPTV
ncbi:tetratricopeptide repeat protein [Robiginitalea sp. SC105]|uniref:tetratricopeptide repeat protein n=1 Tax=Robiginitalea sp. SC105 TaxID=2762332 RepID=UPI00351C8D42